MSSTSPSAKPDAGKKYRVNLTLPADMAVMLSETASNMGVSQSALIASLLNDSLPPLHKFSKRAKSLSDPDSFRIFRGESIDVILRHVGSILKKI